MKHRFIYPVFPALLLLLASCAGLKINEPGPEKQTILVLPVQVTNTSMTSRHLFYYVYEIVSEDKSTPPYQAIFKLPIQGDMLLVDSLPPGEYRVTKFTFLPTGSSADHSYGENSETRNDRFKLESGKVTVFSKSLYVSLRNETPGRIGETVYGHAMINLSRSHKKEVLATLQKVPNFEKWEVMVSQESSPTSSDLTANQVAIQDLNARLPMMTGDNTRLDVISISPNPREYNMTMTAFGEQASNIKKVVSLYGDDHLRISLCSNFSESEEWNSLFLGFPINITLQDESSTILSEFQCD